MKKHVLIYGILCGLLIAALNFFEYRFLVVEHSLKIYGAMVAVVFASVGIWLGLKFTKKEEVIIVREIPVIKEIHVPIDKPFSPDSTKQRDLGITKRELEILGLIAQGLSNRDIAERLFVSENTVKTHSSRLLEKLDAKRRTQAVQIGKELGLIP